MRVLITGASGYLGRHVLQILPVRWQTLACFHRQPPQLWTEAPAHANLVALDLADAGAVQALVDEHRPNLVLHLAINRQPEQFGRVIVDGSAAVALAAAQMGARLIHLSTDIVLDGLSERYDESALPCPEPPPGATDLLSSHGRAKARAEAAVLAHHPDPTIVRTSLIYGFEPLDHSTGWLAAGLRQGQTVTLFTDQIRCPIYAPDLAACLVALCEIPYHGVLNVAGPQALSRYEFGLLLCQALDLDPTGIVAASTPVDMAAPRNLILSDDRAAHLLPARRAPGEVCELWARRHGRR